MPTTRCLTISSSLQRGRGRETAESSSARPRWGAPTSLQRGRGRETAESCAITVSIRRRCGFNGAAVVRPRRGKHRLPQTSGPQWLQRGRGRETAERRILAMAPHGLPMLQRGRGRETAESAAEERGGGRRRPRFNGAAVVRPRRA